ncbi:MAG: cytochrome c oxidase assembly protein [Candidatus Rokubacteria bacterium]|nr:cytochrome c oxidase assembly protein [Candidatus Rokubacteria bacterium]
MNLWHWHPSVLLGLGGVLAAYLVGLGRLRSLPPSRPAEPADEVGARPVLFFVGGVLGVAAALLGPLAKWAEDVALSAHMGQHLILILVVPPLWLAGTPAGLLRPVLAVPGVRGLGHVLTRPIVALLLATCALVAWHLPAFFEAALRHEAVHVLEHLTLLGTALLAWWPVLGRLPEWPRLAPPAQLLYLFLCTLPMTVVAAPITLADGVLYPYYEATGAPWPLPPRADQELAGVLMWVGGTLGYVVVGTVAFFGWATAEEPAERGAAVLTEEP